MKTGKGKKNKAEQEEESSKTFKKLRHKHSAVESDINRLEHHGLDRYPDKGLNAFKKVLCIGCVSCEFAQVGRRASGEGTRAVRKVTKSRLVKQKTLRKTVCREDSTPRQG